MPDAKEKFVELMYELFELRHADLDFGIYRIINAKRDVLEDFIRNQIPNKVEEAFRSVSTSATIDENMRAQVYNDLYEFFRYYYQDGDFVTRRRIRGSRHSYAIPYDGSEVALYWANHDQYYIKSSPIALNREFKLNNFRFVFRVVNSSESAEALQEITRNVKRRNFQLARTAPVVIEGNQCTVSFELKSADAAGDEASHGVGGTAEERYLQGMHDDILGRIHMNEMKLAIERSADEKGQTALLKHLRAFTAKFEADFFIHKNLKKFLLEQLDYYLKTWIISFDDLGNASHVARAKIVREVATDIVEFLHQIEEFQRILWEKKKFVLMTHYVVTTDRIPELWDQVLANGPQISEWAALGIPIPKTKDDLKGKTYPVDTKHFPQEFKERVLTLLSRKGPIDEMIDGIAIKSENWQALNLLLEKYRQKVKCIYIDPPFNSKTTEILYKNTYKHSSWLSLMSDRIALSRSLLSSDSVFVCAIDENEQERLGLLLDLLFVGADRTCVTVVHNPRGIQGKGFSYTNEFAYFIHRQGLNLGMRLLGDTKAKPLMKTGFESERETAKNCFYPIYVKGGQVVRVGDVPCDDWHPDKPVRELESGEVEVWPISSTDSKERKWRYARQSIDSVLDQLEVRKGRNGWPVIYLGKTRESYRTVWADPDFNAAEYGSTLLKNIVDTDFSFPKSVWTIFHSLRASNVGNGDVVLDYFAGSGTTAHAVINLNREDEGIRKYILVEIGDWFNTVILPRIKKVVFSSKWKEGKAVDGEGISHSLKYQVIEQYEDTLHNIEFQADAQDAPQLVFQNSSDAEKAKHNFTIKYMLGFEARDSASFPKARALPDPFGLKLKVITMGGGEQTINVDLVETFNYVAGIGVGKYIFKNDGGRKYIFVLGSRGQKPVAVVWRNLSDIEEADGQEAKQIMEADKRFIENTLSDAKFEPIEVWANYDAIVPSYKNIDAELSRLTLPVQSANVENDPYLNVAGA